MAESSEQPMSQAAPSTQPATEDSSDVLSESVAGAAAPPQKAPPQQDTDTSLMNQPALNLQIQRWLGELFLSTPQQPFVAPPVDFPEGAQSMEIILDRLRNQLRLSSVPKSSLCAGGTHLTVLAQSLATYLSVGLFPKQLEMVCGQITAEVTKWLLSVFKLPANSFAGIYHRDPQDSLVKAIRVALHLRYGKHLEDGMANVLNTRPPAIYISMAGNQAACQEACVQLGLPTSVITTVPCNTVFGSTHSMDIAALERCINDDTANGKTPLLVIACVGTPVAGHIDNLTRLRELTTDYNIWLHATGTAIATLCFKNPPLEVKPLEEVDSMLVLPGPWFGLLGSPCVTLFKKTFTFKSPQASKPAQPPEGETDAGQQEETPEASTSHHSVTKQVFPALWTSLLPTGSAQLMPLTLWMTMQYLGTQSLVNTVIYSNNLAKQVNLRLGKIVGVKRMEVPNHWCHVVLIKYTGGGEMTKKVHRIETPSPQQSEEHKQAPDSSMTTPPLEGASASLPSVAGEDTTQPPPTPPPPTTETITIPELSEATSNAFTQMLAAELTKMYPSLGLTTTNLPQCGNCIRFDPSQSFPERGGSRKDAENFCNSLEEKSRALYPTTLARHVFQSAVLDCANLRYLDFPASVAVGFVQYIPSDWANKKELTVEEVKRLNQQNYDLMKALNQHTNLYTGYQHGNFTCIALKKISETDDIFHLTELLMSEVAKYEDSNKYIEGMTDMIVKGIHAAQQDLAVEKEKAQQEESVLKSLPLVGSLYGWLVSSPTGNTKGRSFNLQSGKIESTESTYKYHMQIKEGEQVPSMTASTSGQDQAESDSSGEEESGSASNENED